MCTFVPTRLDFKLYVYVDFPTRCMNSFLLDVLNNKASSDTQTVEQTSVAPDVAATRFPFLCV